RDPEVRDPAGRVDIGQGEGLPCPDVDAGRDLPALAEVAGGPGTRALGGAAASGRRAVDVLRADGSRQHRAQAGDGAGMMGHGWSTPSGRIDADSPVAGGDEGETFTETIRDALHSVNPQGCGPAPARR